MYVPSTSSSQLSAWPSFQGCPCEDQPCAKRLWPTKLEINLSKNLHMKSYKNTYADDLHDFQLPELTWEVADLRNLRSFWIRPSLGSPGHRPNLENCGDQTSDNDMTTICRDNVMIDHDTSWYHGDNVTMVKRVGLIITYMAKILDRGVST